MKYQRRRAIGKRICTPVKSSCESDAVNKNNMYIYKKIQYYIYFRNYYYILLHLVAQSHVRKVHQSNYTRQRSAKTHRLGIRDNTRFHQKTSGRRLRLGIPIMRVIVIRIYYVLKLA